MKYYLKNMCLILLSFFSIQGKINCDELLKPKVRLELASKQQKSGGALGPIMYFDNFPRNENIRISFNRPLIDNQYKKLDVVKINNDGLICIKGKKYLFYSLADAYLSFPGELINYRYEFDNGNLITEASFILQPLRFISKYGTFYVDIELKSTNPTIYEFDFFGLDDKEILSLSSITDMELVENTFEHPSRQLYMPGVINKHGGVSKVKISRKSGDYVYFQLNWGISLIERILEKL